MRRGRRGRRQRRRGTGRDEGGAGADVLRGEREGRAPEGKVWMGSEDAGGEGNRKRKRGKEKTEKNKKIKKWGKTILFNLKVQQQLFNFYLTISSSILYICNRMSKFYKSQKMSNLPAYIRLYKC